MRLTQTFFLQSVSRVNTFYINSPSLLSSNSASTIFVYTEAKHIENEDVLVARFLVNILFSFVDCLFDKPLIPKVSVTTIGDLGKQFDN